MRQLRTCPPTHAGLPDDGLPVGPTCPDPGDRNQGPDGGQVAISMPPSPGFRQLPAMLTRLPSIHRGQEIGDGRMILPVAIPPACPA